MFSLRPAGRPKVLTLVAAGATLLGTLYLAAPPAGAAKSKKAAITRTYTLKSTAESITNLTPALNINSCNHYSMADVYDQLVRSKQTGKLVPGLAKSWTSSNGGKTFTMHLHSGVKFQDGTTFDAQAVATAIKRGKTTPQSVIKGTLKTITSVTTPNATTVVLHLANPVAGTMPALFNGPAGEIPSPTAVAKYGPKYGVTAAVGAGPYQFVSFRPNTSLTLSAFKTYWTKPAQTFGGVQFLNMSSKTTTLDAAAVAQGTYDMVSMKDATIPIIKKVSGVKYVASPSTQYADILLNSSVAPWNNLKVRQAAELAINRQALVQVMTTGVDVPATQPLGPKAPGHTPSLAKLYPYNASKAKKLLAQAGYKSGLPITMGEIAFTYYEKMATAVAQMLDAVGFKVTLSPFPATAVLPILYTQKKYDAADTAYLSPIPGTYGILFTAFASTGAYNISGPAPAGIDSNLAKAAKTTNAAVQKKAFQAVSAVVMKKALQVPLYYNDGVNVFSPRIHNDVFGQTTCTQADLLDAPYIYAAKS